MMRSNTGPEGPMRIGKSSLIGFILYILIIIPYGICYTYHTMHSIIGYAAYGMHVSVIKIRNS